LKRELPKAPSDPERGTPPPSDERALAPPPSDEERAAAQRLRAALDDADAPHQRGADELAADLEAQVRAAVMMKNARLVTQFRATTQEQLRESLAKIRARVGPGPEERARASRRNRIIVAAGVGMALAAGLILPIVLRPGAPLPRDASSYAKVFPAPFTRDTRALERIDRMIAWRRDKR